MSYVFFFKETTYYKTITVYHQKHVPDEDGLLRVDIIEENRTVERKATLYHRFMLGEFT